MMIERSPSGKIVCQSSGPTNAKIVFIGESPAGDEMANLPMPVPFVGKAGKMLNSALRKAGIDRDSVYLMNCVPVRAPGDKFASHDHVDIEWGRKRFARELGKLNPRVIVALGANPFEWILGSKPPVAQRGEGKREGFISSWRGSVIPANGGPRQSHENYLHKIRTTTPINFKSGIVIIPTFHPAAVLRQFNWHPLFLMDIAKAAKIAKDGLEPTKYRKWFFQNATELTRLANNKIDLLAYDSELEPQICSVTTDTETHVFEYGPEFHDALESLMTNPRILKVAHNWVHDYADLRVKKGIKVSRPIYDTQGGAHILNTALQKELSPHISTRYTNWPYHKWLSDLDPMVYCGMDSIVCYDAYWPQMDELHKRGLYDIANHDHKLLMPLMEMQGTGFKIDETARLEVERDLKQKLNIENFLLQSMVEPVIAAKVNKFEKPHLFRVDRKCDCCGGGKTQREHCESCAQNVVCWIAATQEVDYKKTAEHHGFKTIKEYKASFPSCGHCKATGKITKKLPFNSDSPDQLADVIYRGLGIRARKFKGNETTKAAQLDPIKDKHPIIAKVVEVSEIRADYDTVSRLRAGNDGMLHCVFDPFGTTNGRVASKESLLEAGTNGQNLPEAARRFIVARDGFVFLHPDMAQIEARITAVHSKDKNLIDAYITPIDWPGHAKHGKIDSHTKVVQMMMGSGVQISRDQAKRLTYAIINGGQAAQLAVELNAEAFRKGEGATVTTAEVQFMIDTFFRVFPGVARWHNAVCDEVERTRKLRCPLTGRERTWLGYIMDTKTKELKNEIGKQAKAFLPQCGAAYVLAEGLIEMRYDSGEWGDLLTPVQHGHDALLIECPVGRLEEGKALATKLLTRELWGMTFPAEMKVGKNWWIASGGE